MDGFVVCDEHVDVLVAAWEEDRAEHEKKEKEVRVKVSFYSLTRL